jgi:Uma2 family endonuclease
MAAKLHEQLAQRPCYVFVSDMRVRVSQTGLYTYPDVIVACGQSQFLDANVDSLLNPTMIVEVLSPSTESYDRGAKFGHYRRLPSLKEYVIVAQDQILVERYFRHGDDWLLTDFRQLEDTLPLRSIDCELRLSDIYAKVEFERPAAE